MIVSGWPIVGRGWWMNWVAEVSWIGNWFCKGISIWKKGFVVEEVLKGVDEGKSILDWSRLWYQNKSQKKEQRREEPKRRTREKERRKKLSSLLSRIVTFHFICRIGQVALSGEISPWIERKIQRNRELIGIMCGID